MKKLLPTHTFLRYTICLLSLCMSLGLSAQTICPQEDYILESQADVDAFPADCTSITGDLIISGTDITDLTPLMNITEIGEDLSITNNTVLTNIDGLSALSSIGDDLIIEGNAALTDLNGLSALSSVEYDLIIKGNAALTNINGLSTLSSIEVREVKIEDNDALTNVDGLSALTSITGSLTIKGNVVLTNLNGLSGLTSVEQSLNIEDNDALTNIDGLSALTSIVRYLTINANAALTDIDGLSGLTSIGNNLIITNNTVLTNIGGLSALTSIGERLTIERNAALMNLDGLSALNSIGDKLIINANAALTDIDGLSALTSIGGFLSIEGNRSLTNIDGLSALTSIGGFLLIKDNSVLADCSGIRDLLEADASDDSTIMGAIDVIINSPGCNSVMEILGNSCPNYTDGNVRFTTQAELDDWAACNGSITAITGSLTIQGNDITDLTPLMNITKIGGDLIIQNNANLANVDGLLNVTEIGGGLRFQNNVTLSSLDGLSNLTTIVGGVRIRSNAALTSLDGLSNLTEIGRDLFIQSNGTLANINGLSNLTEIGATLDLSSNSMLANVDGLSNVTSLGGNLQLLGNSILANLNGLSNLTEIGFDLIVNNNDNLTNLDGLSNVTSLRRLEILSNDALANIDGLSNVTEIKARGYVTIRNNDALANVNGLSNVISIMGNLSITENDALAACCGVFDILQADMMDGNVIMGGITISNNLAGCNSVMEITDNDNCLCPDLSAAPAALSLTSESSCQADCSLDGGAWALVAAPCPMGSKLQLFPDATATTGGTDITEAPTYNQDQAETFHVRCVCENRNDQVSPVQTISSMPAECTPIQLAICECPDLSAMPAALSVASESTCQADCTLGGGAWALAAAPCPMGSSLQSFPDATSTMGGTILTAAPTYDQDNPQTFHVRCVCEATSGVSLFSPVQTISSMPGACLEGFELINNTPICPREDIVFTATEGASNYEFFQDMNANGVVDMGESLQTGASNMYITDGLEDEGTINVSVFITDTDGLKILSSMAIVESFNSEMCRIELVPTMSEWGLFLFGLMMVNLGLVFMYHQQRIVA